MNFLLLQSQVFIYLYATSIDIENVPRCVRRVIFGRYILQHVKNLPRGLWLVLPALVKDRLSAVIS